MNYVDATFVRLGDETARAALFDQDALAQILTAAYDADAMTLDGPYQPLFDELELGTYVQRRGAVDARWNGLGGSPQYEGQFIVTGLGTDSTIRVDALWRGSIVARTNPADSRVETVQLAWPDAGAVDAQIVAALGALPADLAVLEAQRRSRLLAAIRATLGQPAAFTDAVFDRWLARVGAASVGDLLARFRNQLLTGGLQLAYSAPSGAAPLPKALPLTSAIFVRDAGFSVAQLVADSQVVAAQLREAGVERPRESGTAPRRGVVVTWIVPETVFDDADWPGGDAGTTAAQKRALRRAGAGRWLAREGIGLAVTAAKA